MRSGQPIGLHGLAIPNSNSRWVDFELLPNAALGIWILGEPRSKFFTAGEFSDQHATNDIARFVENGNRCLEGEGFHRRLDPLDMSRPRRATPGRGAGISTISCDDDKLGHFQCVPFIEGPDGRASGEVDECLPRP